MYEEDKQSKDIVETMLDNHNKDVPSDKPDRKKYCENCMKMDTETLVKEDSQGLTTCAVCHTRLSTEKYEKAMSNNVLNYQKDKCEDCKTISQETEVEKKFIFGDKYHVCGNCGRMLSTDEYFQWKNK